MFPLVAIFAGVAIGVTALSWLYDSLTEEEKERQNQLNDELSELKNKFNLEINSSNQNMYEIARSNFDNIKNKFLEEVNFFKNEKKDIKKDLGELANSIRKELQNESISPYQKQSLLDNRNKVEDAKNRLDTYWLYLDWFENKLDELAKYKKYQDIFDLEMPQALLPEEYLYLGKLAYITKDEIVTNEDHNSKGWNKYGQKLQLNDYHNKKELDLYESYNQEIEFMILIDRVKNKYFYASVVKGELHQYVLDDMSFEVQPKFNEKENQEKLTLLYNDIYLNLKRNDKLYPLKRYKEYDSFEVKIIEYDLLLKNVFVTEKYNEDIQEISNRSISIVFNINDDFTIEKIKQLEKAFEKSSFQVIDFKDNYLSLKIDTYLLSLEILKNEKILKLKSMSEIDISQTTSNSFLIPFETILIEKSIYDKNYKDLLIDTKLIFNDFLSFINEQSNYITYSSKTSNKDFDFFKKWQKIIDYQIEDNSYETLEIIYNKYEIDKKIVTFYVLNF